MIPVKVRRINNKDKFIIDDNLLPELFSIGETYIFDLSHPSNFQTQMSISKDNIVLEQSDEIELVGTPGFNGAQLYFTPHEIGNRYIFDIYKGILMGSILNPLLILKDIHLYDCESDTTTVLEYIRPQIYEFNILADVNKINIFIFSINNKFKKLNLEKVCPEIFSNGSFKRCQELVIDNKTNSENLSTARNLVNQIKYAKKDYRKIKIQVNKFGQKLGGPNGYGMPPKNNLV
tara:strand:+ start:26 stop:724 length:699 start_codon:yes stop_codon:yes gene_type:complete